MKDIIVAPHSDDAVLSLGGRLLDRKNVEEPFLVQNIFSTCVSTILPEINNPKEITRLNNEEEQEAMGVLGVPLELMYLPEVLLRGYYDWRGRYDNKKEKLIKKIIKSRIAKNRGRFFFPLAIGNHTDHILVRDIALELFEDRFFNYNELFFYEDIPYCLEGGNIGESIGEVEKRLEQNLKNRFYDITKVIDKKMSLISLYKTQYDWEYIDKIREYSRNSENKFIERAWTI